MFNKLSIIIFISFIFSQNAPINTDADTSIHINGEDSLYYLEVDLFDQLLQESKIFYDKALAVNPKDDRFKSLVGKTATIPIVGRKINIVELGAGNGEMINLPEICLLIINIFIG